MELLTTNKRNTDVSLKYELHLHILNAKTRLLASGLEYDEAVSLIRSLTAFQTGEYAVQSLNSCGHCSIKGTDNNFIIRCMGTDSNHILIGEAQRLFKAIKGEVDTELQAATLTQKATGVPVNLILNKYKD